MSDIELHPTDTAPGDQRVARVDILEELKSHPLGLGLSICSPPRRSSSAARRSCGDRAFPSLSSF